MEILMATIIEAFKFLVETIVTPSGVFLVLGLSFFKPVRKMLESIASFLSRARAVNFKAGSYGISAEVPLPQNTAKLEPRDLTIGGNESILQTGVEEVQYLKGTAQVLKWDSTREEISRTETIVEQNRGAGPIKTMAALISWTATVRYELDFERAFRIIWGSQLMLLDRLNSAQKIGLSKLLVLEFYQNAKALWPEALQKYTYDEWVAFLISFGLVRYDLFEGESVVMLTGKGKDFLLYLVESGIGQDKAN